MLLLPHKILGQYPSFSNYSIENGAPTNEFYCVIEDDKGYLWLGSDAGVFRYNGISFEQFTAPELTARSATGLLQTSTGRIYGYNFNNQLFYIENQKLTVIPNWNAPMNAIAAPRNGELWISSTKGLYIMSESTFEFRRFESDHHIIHNLDGDYICKNVRSYDNGKVIYHHHDIVTELDGNAKTTYKLNPEFIGKHLLFSFTQNQPWMVDLESGNLFNKQKGKWEPYNNILLENLLANKKITHVIEIDSNLWISTYAGVISFDLITEHAELYFPQTSFSGGMKDFQGNYWFTTLFEGVIKVSNFNIKTWNKNINRQIDNQFNAITSFQDQLYFSSTKGNILVLDAKTKDISQIHHAPESDISMISVDSIQESLLFHKTAELYELKNNAIKRLGRIGPVKSLFTNKNAGYLICSSYGLFASKNLGNYSNDNTHLANGWFREICPIPNQNMAIVASNNGVYKVNYETGEYLVEQHALSNLQILSVCYNEQSEMAYALSFDGRIFSIHPENLNNSCMFELNPTIKANQIVSNENFLYLATSSGLIRLDIPNKNITSITKLNGLSSNDVRQIFIYEQNCWTATGLGVNMVPLSEFDKNLPLSRIYLNEVILGNKKVQDLTTISINYNQGLTVIVDGLGYSSENDLQLAYKIDDYTESWIRLPITTGRIDIPKLPSDAKIIRIKLIDHLNRDSENMLLLRIDVRPIFYERWWFYGVIVLAAAIIFFLVFRIRIKQLRKKQRQELKQLKLENELRLTQQNALKAQMNPHFLFNVLNSIKAYIYENDKQNAARYLSDFSLLVRSILELSSRPKISLDKELATLKVYIELEAMLLQDDFDYSITVSDKLNPTDIEIPALILQPYVENAFKHGLRHKNGRKHLAINLSFEENNELLIVTISDNGIGRKAANSINSQTTAYHESFATSAIEKRIQLLNYEQKNLVGVEIIDNFENHEPSGTTVIIRIHVY